MSQARSTHCTHQTKSSRLDDNIKAFLTVVTTVDCFCVEKYGAHNALEKHSSHPAVETEKKSF